MYYDDYAGSIGSLLWFWYERIRGFSTVLPSSPLNVGQRADWVERATHAVMGGTTVTSKVRAPEGGSGLVEMYRIASERARSPLKYGVGALPGNLSFHVDLTAPGSAYSSARALAEDMVPIFNDELKALVRAGCEFIQLDDLSPWLLLQGAQNHWIVDVLNGVIDGVDAKLAWHCRMGATDGNAATDLSRPARADRRGNVRGQRRSVRARLRPQRDGRGRSAADVAGRKEVAIGVIDVRTLQIESQAVVAERMRKALDVVPADRVWFTTDCGMKALHRFTALGKLHSLTAAAETVRAEVASTRGQSLGVG